MEKNGLNLCCPYMKNLVLGKIEKTIKVGGLLKYEKGTFINGKFENRSILPLSLSYDHRIIDGAEGARFCKHLKESLGKDFAYKLAV